MPTVRRIPGGAELQKMVEIYLKAETDIINEIARLRSRGLVDYHAVAALDRVQKILHKLESDAWEYTPKMIEREFYVRVPEARKIPERVEKHAAGYHNAAVLTSEQTAIVEKLTMNLMGQITQGNMTVMENLQNALLGRTEPDIYRRVGLEQTALRQATGRGVNASVPDFVETLRREGVTAFTDKAGRNWNIHTYGTMVLRTTARQAEVLSVLTADPDQDLYKISSHGTTCKICAPFEGRVYSRSGTDPDFPPLAAAFGKINPSGSDDLSNTYLNIHPNCLHALVPWTPAGRSKEELQKIKDFSNPQKNPFDRDPRTKAQIEAYRKKERGRASWLREYHQWERYRETIPEYTPDTFKDFQKHKHAGDDKYRTWQKEYRRENKRLSFEPLVGEKTSTGIQISGVSRHVVDRAISRGFTADGMLDALQNPKRIGKIKIAEDMTRSIIFTGEKAAVVIDPDTGNLITGWRK